MLYLIAAIIFTTKKRTGWSVFAWFLTCIYFAVVLYAAAIGMLDEISWLAGWVLLLVSIVISTKKPDDVVITNNYYSAPSYSNVPPVQSAPVNTVSTRGITGTNTPVYFCPKCKVIFSGDVRNKKCFTCGTLMQETTILRDEWIWFTSAQKNNMITEFEKGNYLMDSPVLIPNHSTVSDVDEIRKYKELFDSGIITEEEFAAKKKQLLGI